MTDKPTTTTTAEVAETEKRDTTLGVRRLLVLVISFGLGTLVSLAGLWVFPALFGKPTMPLDAAVPISVLNIPLVPLAALPLGLFFMIWVDYFMGTKIVPD